MNQSATVPQPQPRLSGLKVFFITMAAVIIGMVLFVFLFIMFITGLATAAAAGSAEPPAKSTVLEIDLRASLLDAPVAPTLFSESPASVVGIVQALDRAKTDDRVKGVFIRGETGGLAPASAEEMRLALLDFKSSGKFVITHAQGLNSTSVIPYQAISASDEIWLQASTSIATSGLYSQSEFLGGTMELIGAQPQFIRHGAYKNAVNSYTEEGYTPEHREAMESLLTSIFDESVDNIASDRDISRDVLIDLLATAPHTAADAKAAGLIDRLGYLEEARDHICERVNDEDVAFKPIADYKPKGNYGKPVIALIEGQGTILPGQSG
ncbi:MAG: S49 family peptidase, partial [Pseudomonadota bacterium]